MNTALPTISGTPVQGQTLTASTGSWTNSPTSYAYKWQRCSSGVCSAISGATSSQYLLQAADVGSTIDVVVTASNRYGSTSATSAQTATVTAPASPTPPPSPTVPGAPSNVAGTAGDQSVKLSWTAPSSDGGSAITSYRITPSINGTAQSAVNTGSNATTYTVTGLTNGTGYTFKVAATNSVGTGPDSSASATITPTAPAPPPPPPSGGLSVAGNVLHDANGNLFQPRGVNFPGNEYACIQGWGIFDGPTDDASVTALASWHINIVHLGLNEDCVLGINGVKTAYAGANYMNAIKSYVNLLHTHGIYAEVALFWEAPGTQQATGHAQVLDADHSGSALQVIANTFKDDPKTIIGLDSEPHNISWACWANGGSSCSVGYQALGMKDALAAVRGTGATNVVAIPGIDWANDVSQWLTYRPAGDSQLVAESHVYGGNSCATTSCLDSQQAPVAAQVPLLWGETGEHYDGNHCGSSTTSSLINWADQHGVGYEFWHWNTWGDCLDLIQSYNGTPAGSAYAQWVHDHLVSLP